MRLGVTVSTAWGYYKVCYVFITIIGYWSLRLVEKTWQDVMNLEDRIKILGSG